MRIGIDVRPLVGRRAGIGYYVFGLLTGLDAVDQKNEYYLYAHRDFPLNLKKLNSKKKIIKAPGIFWHLLVALDIFFSKVDLYHSTHSFILPLILGKKTVTTYLDASAILLPQTHSLKVKLMGKLFSSAARRTAKILAISQSTKKDTIKIAGINNQKITVTYCAVDRSYQPISREKASRIRQKYNLPKKFLFYNATLEPRKNPLRIIEAYSQLKTKHKKIDPLVMVGKMGWMHEDIFRLIKELHLEKDVIFTGWVPEEDLPFIYGAASLLIYPSLYEGFGLSPLKAFACGVPVITSNNSSMREVCQGAAILVNPYDKMAIADAIKKVVTNLQVADDLRQQGFKKVKKFSWENTAKRTLAVYRQASR